MGLKEAGLRGSLRNVSVGADVIPDSGVSRWTFNNDNISNDTLVDVWGSNDGTIEGMTTTTGIYPYDNGEAGDFDGANDRVSFGQIPELSGVSEFSLAVWVNLDAASTGENQILIGADPDVDNGIRLAEASGQLRCLVEKNTTRAFADGGTLSAGTTELCVLTYGGQTVTGYIGGTEVLSASGGPSSTPSLEIYAGFQSRNGAYTDGVLDEGRLYSRELSGTEVLNLNDAGSIDG